MPAPPVVSVVIPARNAGAVIGAQLAALAAQEVDVPWELIVVDHGSTDGTTAVLGAWADRLPHLTVVDGAGLPSIPAVRNRGIEHAAGELIVNADADDVVADGWLAAMVDGLGRHPMVTGPLDLVRLNDPALASWRTDMPSDRAPSWHRYLPAALTCNLGVRREVLASVGAFVERYRSGSDLDFVWRGQEAGFDLVWEPAALVYRRLPPTGWRSLRRNIRYGRYEPMLFADHAAAGMPRSSTLHAVATWGWLAVHLPDLLVPERRYRWLTHCGDRTGRLIGSIECRRLYL